MKILKESVRSGVLWEQDDDGKNVVRAGGDVLVETGVEALAKLIYDEAVLERDPARELRERERAHWDVEDARWGGFRERSTKNKGKSGKGGRGGV